MLRIHSALLLASGLLAFAPASSAANWGNNNNGCGGGYGGGHNGGGHDDDCDHGGGWGGGHDDDDDDCGGGNNNKNKLKCDAGGPYDVCAQGAFVTVQLDGRDSKHETGYRWSTNFPGALFDDDRSATPTLTIPVTDTCGFDLTVRLTVTNSKGSKTCSTKVEVRDCTPPVITCPPDAKVFCGTDTSPKALGYAEATDNCDQNVKITYSDTIEPATCAANRFDSVIRRRWRARDDDKNTATCVQVIDVVKQITSLDIFPGVAPNAYDPNACDLVPVTILGLDAFHVGNIQWNTVKLYGRNCDGGPVNPKCFTFGDVAGPFFGTKDCETGVVPPDGRLDLTVWFQRSKLNQRLGLDELPAGTVVPIVITGRLACDGCKFIAEDCIVVL